MYQKLLVCPKCQSPDLTVLVTYNDSDHPKTLPEYGLLRKRRCLGCRAIFHTAEVEINSLHKAMSRGPQAGRTWSMVETNRLIAMKRSGMKCPQMAKALGRSVEAVEIKLWGKPNGVMRRPNANP